MKFSQRASTPAPNNSASTATSPSCSSTITGEAKEGRKKWERPSSRAGVTFPASRIYRMLKKGHYCKRVSAGAPVYLAKVLEYLTANVLELAGNVARDRKQGRIIPRYLLLAIQNDEELSKLLQHVNIFKGGVVPRIHPELLPKATSPNKQKNM
ncbi:histone H2A.J-like [Rhipicephalus microplus]|uniref:histone H2A.J-like n=1 Tax=Rhipicephalus microplus TaxID=6941 RepID=UPI003F6D5D27